MHHFSIFKKRGLLKSTQKKKMLFLTNNFNIMLVDNLLMPKIFDSGEEESMKLSSPDLLFKE